MAVMRPWVTPGEVRDYTDSTEIAQRADGKLKVDIFRAEQKVIAITHNSFDDEKLEEIPEPVRMAVLIIAEAYANNSIEQSRKQIKSETFDDYSYTLDGGMIDIDGLDLDYLLRDFMEDAGNGNVRFRMSVI